MAPSGSSLSPPRHRRERYEDDRERRQDSSGSRRHRERYEDSHKGRHYGDGDRHSLKDDRAHHSRHDRRDRSTSHGSSSEEDRERRRRRQRDSSFERERASRGDHRDSRRHRDDDERGDRERHRSRHHSHRETSEERQERKRRKRERREQEAAERAKAVDALLYSSDAVGTSKGAPDTETFVWAKKAEQERKQGMTPAEAKARDERRRREMEEERHALSIRIAQREKEKKEREQADAIAARQNVDSAEAKWVADEDKFDLKQARAAALRRVRDDRAKPVDPYVIDVRWLDMDDDGPATYDEGDDEDMDDDIFRVNPEKPHALVEDMDIDDMEEVHEDIIKFLTLETSERKRRFWSALLVVCNDKLYEIRSRAGIELSEEQQPWKDLQHKAEVDAIFSTKTPEELRKIKEQVQTKLDQDERIQVEHWLNYKRAIEVWQAKAKLADYYESILENRLSSLKEKQQAEEQRRRVLGLPSLAEEKAQKAAEAARRRAERDANQTQDAGIAMARAMMAREAENNELGEDDNDFNRDEALKGIEAASQRGSYAMDDKYRPRKPTYYNKVHTGYDWNKYNQTHYDSDNPPPKLVQGYKFNIFYPDLIDKSKPPSYRIQHEPGNDETCLLIFEAGPPYETIAFRIVNKKWNTKPQRGFKAVFERGMLQLWFNFQRMFYRK